MLAAQGQLEAINANLAAQNAGAAAATTVVAPAALDAPRLSTSCNGLLGTGNNTNPAMLGGIFGPSNNGANILNIGGGNWTSAASALFGMAGGGLLPAGSDTIGDAGAAAALASETTPMEAGVKGMAGMGGAGGRDGPGHAGRQLVGPADLGGWPGHPGGRHQHHAAADRGLRGAPTAHRFRRAQASCPA